MLEDEITARVWKSFGGAGSGAAEIPLDEPEMLNHQFELGRWGESLVEEVTATDFGL